MGDDNVYRFPTTGYEHMTDAEFFVAAFGQEAADMCRTLSPDQLERTWLKPVDPARYADVMKEFKRRGANLPCAATASGAKYAGLHALRHFFCSWCAARPQDRGLVLPLKTVQVRMGHSTLAMTADTYRHLFPSQDDAEVLAAGEAALMRA